MYDKNQASCGLFLSLCPDTTEALAPLQGKHIVFNESSHLQELAQKLLKFCSRAKYGMKAATFFD
ncbi:MAG: hypothetical protein OEW04_11615 [Nitrospirota bacterium]|nr:hypothetical protein [Nitrospirota bacterium]